ncbi:MAG: tRNA dimethylallyltransferase [Pseudomonadota bacterium]
MRVSIKTTPGGCSAPWEVHAQTGRTLSDWQADPTFPTISRNDTIPLILQPETHALNARITARLRTMIAQGALEECADNLGLDPTRPAAKALGADVLTAHLRGEMTLDEAVERAAIATHQFAKRQRTWIRSRFSDWTPVAGMEFAAVASLVRSSRPKP